MSDTPRFLCVGTVIIDDIVFPDGVTRMAVLGGGSTHAAAGMLVWGERAGLYSYIGNDLPEIVKARLERDFDTQGWIRLDLPQIRAWQIFEWNGRRTEIFRNDSADTFLIGPEPDQVPEVYRHVKGVHHLEEIGRLPHWRALFPDTVILWEPSPPFMVSENRERFRDALPFVDIVSPNLLEASLLYGANDPVSLVRSMLADGAKIAVLRMGEAGSLAGMGTQLVQLPAVPVPEVVDQTGAGNAYCGAFLVGWVETQNLRTAACYGGVAASFTLEVIGVSEMPSNLAQLRDERYQ
jgi:sugar/nucleoside kinase (ribokinase family)